MQSIMGAISSKSEKFFFLTKPGYYNSDDTIKLLKYIRSNHRNDMIAVFWDNESYHVSA